jgi:hypothetical protein
MFRKKGKTSKTVNGLDLGTNGTGPVTQGDPWEKTTVRREDVVDLLKACCDELKSRGYTHLTVDNTSVGFTPFSPPVPTIIRFIFYKNIYSKVLCRWSTQSPRQHSRPRTSSHRCPRSLGCIKVDMDSSGRWNRRLGKLRTFRSS